MIPVYAAGHGNEPPPKNPSDEDTSGTAKAPATPVEDPKD